MNKEDQYQKTLSRLLKRLDVTVAELQGGSRMQRLVDARCMVAASLDELQQKSQQDIALILNTTQGTVSRLIARHRDLLESDLRYRQRWNNFMSEMERTNIKH